MGTTVGLWARGPAHVLDVGEEVVRRCERRWSRFRPSSELSRLNAASGQMVVLEPDTYELVAAAVRCWHLTSGRFDPTVERAMSAAGYDRTFEEASRSASPSAPSPGCAGIELDDDLGAVGLPADVRLDLGGIAKGHAADLAATAMIAAGAEGALADLGGDVACTGRAEGEGWAVGVEDPFVPGAVAEVLHLTAGAVATSSVLRRRWLDGSRPLHHLIDPRTGEPSRSDLAAVTIVAATASWAEVLAKATLIGGVADAPRAVAGAGATGLAFTVAGDVIALPGLERFT
jgi:thiamine biosynthesis lipoprotein